MRFRCNDIVWNENNWGKVHKLVKLGWMIVNMWFTGPLFVLQPKKPHWERIGKIISKFRIHSLSLIALAKHLTNLVWCPASWWWSISEILFSLCWKWEKLDNICKYCKYYNVLQWRGMDQIKLNQSILCGLAWPGLVWLSQVLRMLVWRMLTESWFGFAPFPLHPLAFRLPPA